MADLFTEAFGALSNADFDEVPVDIETFATSEEFLGLPPLSDYQYQMIRAGSQIYKADTLIGIYGEDKGRKRFEQTCNEVVLQLGKGSMSLDTELFDANTGCWKTLKESMFSDNSVATLDRRTGVVIGGYATEAFHSVTEMAYDVTTVRGFKFRVNAGHKFITPGLISTPLFELNPKDKIAVPALLPVSNEVRLDDREVKLLGYWLGDGMMPLDTPGKRVINMDFSNNDSNAMNEYVEILKSYGDNPTVTKHANKAMWFVRTGPRTGPATLEIARKHGLWNKRANNKDIPDAVWSLPKDQLATFISRLWGTDGCVYMKKCGKSIQPILEYTTISEKMAVGIQRLLARLGIIAGLRSRFPTYTYKGQKKTGQEAFRLTISDSEGFSRFNNAITMMDKSTSRGMDVIASKSIKSSRYDGDIYWDSIKEIKEVGTEELFTVTAPEHENYVANMVLNGNSGK